MRSVVMIHGLLRGMGREASCEMLAMRESVGPVYSGCSVIDAPHDLPDGLYTVSFSGHVVPARKEGGLWLPEGTTSPLQIHPRSSELRRSFEFEQVVEILPLLKKNHIA
jgi:hypothetical protein